MKIPFSIQKSAQKVSLQKIDKYIEIAVSNNPRLNDLPEDARLSVLTALRKRYTKVAITIVEDMASLESLVAKKPDLVVLGLGLVLSDSSKSYDDSPKVWLSNYLKENNINFAGSATEALMLQRNKHEAKQKVLDADMLTSKYFTAQISEPMPQHDLMFPLFVKPTNRGDGKGIDEKSLVHSQLELESKVLSIHDECGSDALVEEYLPGREFSVAVVQQPNSDDLLLMPVEIVAPADKQGNKFLSEAVKKADSERALAVHDPELKSRINTLAIGVFKALGARDYGRIDMRLDALGAPNFIEANLMPGLSAHGYLARCFYMNDRIGYEDMILSIVDLCLQRMPLRMPEEVPGELYAGSLASPGAIV
jgi:D-alanine-D-alanine ligase